jgi:hypothetical protein
MSTSLRWRNVLLFAHPFFLKSIVVLLTSFDKVNKTTSGNKYCRKQ